MPEASAPGPDSEKAHEPEARQHGQSVSYWLQFAHKIESTEEFIGWLSRLKDLMGRARVQARIERLADGNPGDHRVLTGGICELKVNAGPGYRVYYTRKKDVLIILLIGGDKASQRADITRAKELAANYIHPANT